MQCECIYEAGKVVTVIFVIHHSYWLSMMILGFATRAATQIAKALQIDLQRSA